MMKLPINPWTDSRRYTPTVLATAGIVPFTRRATHTWMEQDKLAHPTRNSFNDPLSITFVLDALLMVDGLNSFSAKDMVRVLTQRHPTILWSPTIVGRILSNIVEAASESGAPLGAKGASNGTNTYHLTVNHANWAWLGSVRHAMGELAEQIIEEEHETGDFALRPDFPWGPFTGTKWGSIEK